MSRSNYSDECEHLGLYRNTVRRSINGARGQAFLRELRDALIAMPDKRLTADAFTTETSCCAMGAVALARGIDRDQLAYVNTYDADDAAKLLGISHALAAEIAFENDDEWGRGMTDAERYGHMLAWAEKRIVEPAANPGRGACSWCCRQLRLRPSYSQRSTSVRLVWHKHKGATCPGVGLPPSEPEQSDTLSGCLLSAAST